MTRISILDPTAPPPEVDPDAGPAFRETDLRGAAIGFRYDLTWRSFDWVRDEWARLLSEEGATVEHWLAGDRTADAAAETLSSLNTFAETRDVVISGLGN